MPRNRRSPGRPGPSVPSVFPMGGGMTGGRQTPVFNPGRGRGPNRLPRTPETAPYADMAGPPPASTLTPNVQAFAPSGPAAFDPGFGAQTEPEMPDLGFQPDTGFDQGAGEGSALVDALLAEEGPPGSPGTADVPNQLSDQLGNLGFTQEQLGQMDQQYQQNLQSYPSNPYGIQPGGWMPYDDAAPNPAAGGLYTGDLLLKKLMQIGI